MSGNSKSFVILRTGHGRSMVMLTAIISLLAISGGAAQAASSITRTSSWTYDSHTGLMTSETIQPNNAGGNGCVQSGNSDTTCVTTNYTYDAYGNKTSVAVSGDGVPSRTTSTVYSGTTSNANCNTTPATSSNENPGQFPLQTANALSTSAAPQCETYNYDSRFGIVDLQTGPNGLTTTWGFDSLGRKGSQTNPDGTWAPYVIGYQTASAAYYTISAPYTQNTNIVIAPAKIVGYDSLGRVTYTAQQALNGSTSAVARTDTQYDPFGHVAQVSNPYWAKTTPIIWTTYAYDALGRVTTLTKPNGNVTTYQYHGLTTSMTNTNSSVVTTTTTVDNDMGLPVKSTDTANNVITYTYDAVGDLLTTTDPSNNVTTNVYDIAGRKIQMTDPDRGIWNFTYDSLGELTSEADANGNTTNAIVYDLLGRMTSRQQSSPVNAANPSGQEDTWTYSNAACSSSACIGKLASEASFNTLVSPAVLISGKTLTYDQYGRPIASAETFVTAGVTNTKTTQTSYDVESRISTVTYPSGFAVTYNYNGSVTWQLNTLTGLSPGQSTAQTLWTFGTNNAASQITNETLGNNVVVNNSFDPNSLVLTGTQAGLAGSSADANFSYTYDTLNNLTQRTDGNEGLTEQFAYDNLYRLTSDQVNGNTAKTFTYDALGDITKKSDVGTYTYQAGHPHAIATITGAGLYNVNATYTYDNNGNTISANGNPDWSAATYTSFNMVASVRQGASTLSYVYDADHNRILQTAPEGTTAYINDPASGAREEDIFTGSALVKQTDYFFASGMMIGMHVTPATGAASNNYFIMDHLGSVAVVLADIGCSDAITVNGQPNPNICAVERDSYDA